MSRVDAAAADRLPWLPDEPAPRKAPQQRANVVGFAAAAILLVAIFGFLVGVRSVRHQQSSPVSSKAQSAMTAPLPRARPAPSPEVRISANPDVRPVGEPQVRPVPTREVRITVPARSRAHQHAAPTKAHARHEAPAESIPVPQIARPMAPPAAQYVLPPPWPPRVISGAAGRLVQIGAFGSRHQAKRGWWFMVRAYPAVAHLPAIVTVTRNSRSRAFYRFQVGTTSQAHSEVLCQRMQMIRLSCAIVGLPWRAKVER